MLIPLNRLLVGDGDPKTISPPAGMNLDTIIHWRDCLRNGGDPVDPPIWVTREGDYWRIYEGRHRAFGAWAAGRSYIEAVEVDKEGRHGGTGADA
jgi:hypothetical protein